MKVGSLYRYIDGSCIIHIYKVEHHTFTNFKAESTICFGVNIVDSSDIRMLAVGFTGGNWIEVEDSAA